MATSTAATGTLRSVTASTVEPAHLTLTADELRHLDKQMEEIAALIATHRREFDLLVRALRETQEMLPPSPFEDMRRAFADHSLCLRRNLEQVGRHLQRSAKQVIEQIG